MRFYKFAAFMTGALLTCASAAFAGGGGASQRAVLHPLALTEFNALKINNRGPAAAAGVVYFIDGLDPSARLPDDFRPTYPYLYALNSRFGWDVINAKYPNSDHDVASSIPRSVAYVAAKIKSLRAEGYKKIVLAGQSWGAWVSINVADKADSAKGLDALMIVAPAAYGSRIWHGKDNPYYLKNLTEYIRSVKSLRTPTVAVFFEGDDFDPGDRGEVTDAFFRRSQTHLLLIDRPPGFNGHGAGWLPSFADIYTACINDFLSAPKDGNCETAQLASSIGQTVAPEESSLLKDQAARAATQQEMAGKSFILTSPDINVRVLKFETQQVEVAAADNASDENFSVKGNQACTPDDCYRVYRQSGSRYLAFNDDGTFAGWLTPVQ